MSDTQLTQAEAEKALWQSLDEFKVGMLGLDRPGQHSQPMTGFAEPETATLWFFTRNDTDLAKDVAGSGQSGMFSFQARDRKVYACLQGLMSIDADRERIDRFWNPVVSAWYPQGKDDPHLTLIRFDATEGRVWLSDKGALGFAYQILKANLTSTLPDPGKSVDIKLA